MDLNQHSVIICKYSYIFFRYSNIWSSIFVLFSGSKKSTVLSFTSSVVATPLENLTSSPSENRCINISFKICYSSCIPFKSFWFRKKHAALRCVYNSITQKHCLCQGLWATITRHLPWVFQFVLRTFSPLGHSSIQVCFGDSGYFQSTRSIQWWQKFTSHEFFLFTRNIALGILYHQLLVLIGWYSLNVNMQRYKVLPFWHLQHKLLPGLVE